LIEQLEKQMFYLVECVRDVMTPSGWRKHEITKTFHIAKGNNAKRQATEFANSMLDQSSFVSIWKMNSNGSGAGEYIKNGNPPGTPPFTSGYEGVSL
jgi:hypothetical protein